MSGPIPCENNKTLFPWSTFFLPQRQSNLTSIQCNYNLLNKTHYLYIYLTSIEEEYFFL